MKQSNRRIQFRNNFSVKVWCQKVKKKEEMNWNSNKEKEL